MAAAGFLGRLAAATAGRLEGVLTGVGVTAERLSARGCLAGSLRAFAAVGESRIVGHSEKFFSVVSQHGSRHIELPRSFKNVSRLNPIENGISKSLTDCHPVTRPASVVTSGWTVW